MTRTKIVPGGTLRLLESEVAYRKLLLLLVRSGTPLTVAAMAAETELPSITIRKILTRFQHHCLVRNGTPLQIPRYGRAHTYQIRPDIRNYFLEHPEVLEV